MYWRPFWYMVEVHVLVIHAWDISLAHCVWFLWFIVRGTSLWYWHTLEAYLMAYGFIHSWGTLWHTVWRFGNMIWGTTWWGYGTLNNILAILVSGLVNVMVMIWHACGTSLMISYCIWWHVYEAHSFVLGWGTSFGT